MHCCTAGNDAGASPLTSSSCPLSGYLDANAVSDVLAYLLQDSVADNPDARLRAFSEIVAHVSSRYTGDFNSSKATSFDSAPRPPSVESGASQEGSKWEWADVLMRGVLDPWSRIRAITLSPMADLILGEVREELALQAATEGESPLGTLVDQPRPTHSAPAGARRKSASKVGKDKKSAAPTEERRRSTFNGKEHAPAPLQTRRVSVSTPLDYVWRHWDNATRWYEHDGIVRLLAKVYGRSRTRAGAALRADELGIRTLIFKVLFPAFRDAQLPVRESAAALLGVLVDRDRPAPLSPAIISFLVDHVTCTLAETPMPAHSRSPLSAAEQERTRVLEGNLLALVVLVDMNVVQVADSTVMPLLLRLSSYPASSVRQYIAQILRPPSWPVFVCLMGLLCEHDGQKPHSAVDDDSDEDDGGELNWQRQETVMMALQQHFLSITTLRTTTRDLFRASSHAGEMVAPLRRTTPLAVIFQAMQSPRFEVARMGTQLLPLLLQCSIRFLGPADLPLIFDACCGPDGCIQQELNRLHAAGDAAALSRAQLTVATVVLPALWFFVTIRRIETEVTGGCAASPASGAPGVSRLAVEEVARPYATLDCVAFASHAHPRTDDGTATNATAGAAPCVASTCALLVLTAYFARVMDRAEWHRCVEEVLKPSWWADILSNPVRREQVRFGPDFVRAVHHCGTPEQSQRIVELIPTLTAALPDAQTHQQCLLIAMIRVAVSACASLSTPLDERALAYVYHDVYTAPALTEGGEAAPLGHTWLKLFVPTHEGVPTSILWGPTEADASGEAKIVIRRDSAVFRALDSVCFKNLFQSTKTEPSVWREIRSLMMSLSRLSLMQQQQCQAASSGQDGDDMVDWYALSLESVFGRLDKICPRWRETVSAAACDGGDGEAADEEGEEGEEEEICWDDWDDDEEDADGCAQGIYEAEAIKTAVAMVSTLREWATALGGGKTAPADERFRSELDALNIK